MRERPCKTPGLFDERYIPEPNTGCWLWTRQLDKDGYGTFSFRKNFIRAHRWSLERKLGRKIKSGMLANHQCHTPSCVNPDHLYEGTQFQNMQDRKIRGGYPKGIGNFVRRGGFCKRGHVENKENTWTHPIRGYRSCKVCRKMLWAEKKQLKEG